MPTADAARMGRRWWLAGSALALSCGLSGCLQLEETIAIAADGSGTQQVTMTMPDATLAECKRAAAVNQTAVADPTALFTKAVVEKEFAAVGLELEKHEAKALDGARTVSLTARFATPGVLRKSPLTGSSAEWLFAPGPVPGTVEVTLYPQGKSAWVEARAKAEAMKADAADAVAADFFQRRRTQLQGLDLRLRLQLPGKVLRLTRNLEQTGEREVEVHITSDRIRTPEDLVRLVAPRFQVVFDASGCPNFPIDR